MLESLLPETKDILERTEEETGLRLRLEPTERQYISRTGLAEFLGQVDPYEIAIKYNPSSQSIDYAIAHEAVRIMRYQRAPPEERYALISTAEHRRVAYQKMELDLKGKPAGVKPVLREMLPIFYDGLITQLGSTPGDFWINKLLYEEYPNFRREIGAGLWDIFTTAHQGLRQDIRVFTPETVYRASNSMNAAFAEFIAELLDRDKFFMPYRGTKFEDLGAKLRSYNLTDRGHLGDKATIDDWARELGLVGWYGWTNAG